MNHAWACVLALFFVGCGRPLDLGTDIIWSTDFEEGGLASVRTSPGAGGIYISDAGDSSVVLTTEHAHSGRYSVKITSSAALPDPGNYPPGGGGGGIYKTGAFPKAAYYSAWYYLPTSYTTTTPWIILAFLPGVPERDQDAGASGLTPLLQLSLESQVNGTMTLLLTDPNRLDLSSTLPVPPPIVVPGRWFQLEAFYRNDISSSGHFTVWFNGTQIYDVARSTNTPIGDGGQNPDVYFMPCSLVVQLGPAKADVAEIYIDDVAISWTRVTPQGVLQVPQ
jgi:hypothetical protein